MIKAWLNSVVRWVASNLIILCLGSLTLALAIVMANSAFGNQNSQINFLLGLGSSPFVQALLGSAGGGLGAFVASVFYSNSQREAQTTNELINEFLSPEIVIVRQGAYTELMTHFDQFATERLPHLETEDDLTTLFEDARFPNLRTILSYIERVSIYCDSHQVDKVLLSKSIGHHLGFWVEFFLVISANQVETNNSFPPIDRRSRSWSSAIRSIQNCNSLFNRRRP